MASMAATQNSVCSVSKATPIVGTAGFAWHDTNPKARSRPRRSRRPVRGAARRRGIRRPRRLRIPRDPSELEVPRDDVVALHRGLPCPYAVGGLRMDSSWALTASGSKTFFQSGLKSTDCASASILRAPSE